MSQNLLTLQNLPDADRPGAEHQVGISIVGTAIWLIVEACPPRSADGPFTQDGSAYSATISVRIALSPHQLDAIQNAIADARSRTGT